MSRFFFFSVLLTILFVVVIGSSLADAQSPTSYYTLQDGVPFVNATNATSSIFGFRYVFEESIQPDQDLLLTLLCSNGYQSSYAASCSAQVSNRPDMLTTIMQCRAFWQQIYCRIPSCLISSNTVYIALRYTSSWKSPIQAFFNISATLETNTPTKV